MDYFLIAAILLMLIGIVGSLYPAIPGVIASLIGLGLYWWSTGYTEPGNIFIAITVFLGVTSIALDWLASSLTAKAGGASDKTSMAAIIAGILGFFFLGGPIGILIATGATVFLREYMRTGDIQKSRKAGLYSALGLVASVFFKVFISVTILIGFIISIIL